MVSLLYMYSIVHVWYDMVWYHMVWYGIVWYMMWYEKCAMIWKDSVWYDMLCYDIIRNDTTWYERKEKRAWYIIYRN